MFTCLEEDPKEKSRNQKSQRYLAHFKLYFFGNDAKCLCLGEVCIEQEEKFLHCGGRGRRWCTLFCCLPQCSLQLTTVRTRHCLHSHLFALVHFGALIKASDVCMIAI